MANCPNCGSTTSEGAIFCDQCGTRLSQPEAAAPEAAPAPASGGIICPACGAGNVPGEAFCEFCGSRLEPPEPQSVPDLEPVSREAELEVAPAPPAPPAQPVEEPAAAQAEEPTCPACGAAAVAGEAYCANCGASLTPAPPEPEAVAEPEPAAAPEPVVEDAPTEPEPAPVPEPEPAPAPEPEPVSVPTPTPIALPICPACGAEVEIGDAYCSACGSSLQAAPDTTARVEAPVSPGTAGPRLVVADSGAEIPLPAGDEILIGREDPVSGIFPDVDLTPHGGEEGGVSRRHARIMLEGTSYFVEDLDSTNFTFVNKQKLAPKVRQPVADGDQIRFGRVAVVLRTGS